MAKIRKNAAVERITVTIPPELKRLLDQAAEGRGLSRSEAAQAAIRDWTKRAREDDLERAFGLAAEVRGQADRLAGFMAEVEIKTGQVYEGLKAGSKQVRDVGDEELRRRSVARRRG